MALMPFESGPGSRTAEQGWHKLRVSYAEGPGLDENEPHRLERGVGRKPQMLPRGPPEPYLSLPVPTRSILALFCLCMSSLAPTLFPAPIQSLIRVISKHPRELGGFPNHSLWSLSAVAFIAASDLTSDLSSVRTHCSESTNPLIP